MKHFQPMLFTDLKSYSAKQFVSDLIAGLIVAVIALPLSIALAIASGVAPEAGLYTAIFAGFLVALLGGSDVQIAGPTAAFATIVAGIVAKNGMNGLMLATIMAGIFLILMGLFKLGNLIRFIPFTITTGFTSGIAVTLVIGQLKDFFGVGYQHGESPVDTMDKLGAFFANLGTVNGQALAVGAVSLLILFLWPKLKGVNKIPASLLAVVIGAVAVKVLDLPVNTIGDLYTVSGKLPALQLPRFSFASVSAVIPDAITIAILAGIESLLSCVVADGMIGRRHRSNTELIGQGVANIASALFGGIPATGAIARTAANIKNGGRTPVAGMVHSVVLLVVLLLAMPYAALIPMPTIAAILISVAYNMCGWRTFVEICKTSPRTDVVVLVVTCLLTVVFDLVVAIEVGMVVACVLFVKRMSDETSIKTWIYSVDEGDEHALMAVPKAIRVFELNGPLFFAVSDLIGTLRTKDFTRCVILRMRSVPLVDTDALRELETFVSRCRSKGIAVVFSHVNAQPLIAMKREGLYERVGAENVCANIDEAMARAKAIVGEK